MLHYLANQQDPEPSPPPQESYVHSLRGLTSSRVEGGNFKFLLKIAKKKLFEFILIFQISKKMDKIDESKNILTL